MLPTVAAGEAEAFPAFSYIDLGRFEIPSGNGWNFAEGDGMNFKFNIILI